MSNEGGKEFPAAEMNTTDKNRQHCCGSPDDFVHLSNIKIPFKHIKKDIIMKDGFPGLRLYRAFGPGWDLGLAPFSSEFVVHQGRGDILLHHSGSPGRPAVNRGLASSQTFSPAVR